MTDSSKYVLALEEARRASAAQDENFAALRSQAGGLVTTAGLCATFLAGVRSHDHVTPWVVVTVAAFVGVVGLAGWVLLPVKMWTTQDARVIASWTAEHNADDDAQRRKLAEVLADQYAANAPRILRRQGAYVVAMMLLAIELVALIVDLWRG